MAVVGDTLGSGVRVVVERSDAVGPPWRYEGEVVTSGARVPLIATLDADGSVTVELPRDSPSGLGEKVRLMVRAVWRHAQNEDAAPPRRIARWRAGQ